MYGKLLYNDGHPYNISACNFVNLNLSSGIAQNVWDIFEYLGMAVNPDKSTAIRLRNEYANVMFRSKSEIIKFSGDLLQIIKAR